MICVKVYDFLWKILEFDFVIRDYYWIFAYYISFSFNSAHFAEICLCQYHFFVVFLSFHHRENIIDYIGSWSMKLFHCMLYTTTPWPKHIIFHRFFSLCFFFFVKKKIIKLKAYVCYIDIPETKRKFLLKLTSTAIWKTTIG